MSEIPPQKYLIRDAQGNVYGPADAALLRDWVAQGRIVAGMFIAERETRHWVEASQHPAIADLLASKPERPAPGPSTPFPASPTPAKAEEAPYSLAPKPASAPQPLVPRPVASYPQPGSEALSYQSVSVPRQNVPGLIGFIASLTGLGMMIFACLPLCACFGGPVSALLQVTAIVLGSIGLYQIRENPALYRGRGLALAALIIGSAELVLLLLALVVGFIFSLTH